MIKIAFADVGDNGIVERFVMDLISSFDVEISDTPDFVFCGDFETHEFLKYDCVRIYITGELEYPDFNVYDYVIGSLHLDQEERYIRYPFYLWRDGTLREYEEALGRGLMSEKAFDRKFCNYIVSNGILANPIRQSFFEQLNEYRKVDSGGHYSNNIGYYVKDKNLFQREYKFSIAFENESSPGYITEKIVEAYIAGTIPIYWGATDVRNEFNENAFINVLSYSKMEDAIQHIISLNEDKSEYLRMLNTPLVKNDSFARNMHDEVGIFIRNIISKDREKAYRRARYGRSCIIESRYKRDVYSQITEKMISNESELSEWVRQKKCDLVYIYGAGVVGKILCDILSRNGIIVNGLIDRTKDGLLYKNIPIVGVDDIVREHNNSIVINTVYGISGLVEKMINRPVEDIFEIIARYQIL